MELNYTIFPFNYFLTTKTDKITDMALYKLKCVLQAN